MWQNRDACKLAEAKTQVSRDEPSAPLLSSFQYKRVCFDRAFLPWTTTAHACAHICHIWVSTLQQLCEGKRDGGREREWERSKQPWGRRQPSLCCGAVAKDSPMPFSFGAAQTGWGGNESYPGQERERRKAPPTALALAGRLGRFSPTEVVRVLGLGGDVHQPD